MKLTLSTNPFIRGLKALFGWSPQGRRARCSLESVCTFHVSAAVEATGLALTAERRIA